jgi:hypothetical protein
MGFLLIMVCQRYPGPAFSRLYWINIIFGNYEQPLRHEVLKNNRLWITSNNVSPAAVILIRAVLYLLPWVQIPAEYAEHHEKNRYRQQRHGCYGSNYPPHTAPSLRPIKKFFFRILRMESTESFSSKAKAVAMAILDPVASAYFLQILASLADLRF